MPQHLQNAPLKPSPSGHTSRYNRRSHKGLHLLLVMFFLTLLTFTTTALLSGGPSRLIAAVQYLTTPAPPKLRLVVGDQQEKIKPLAKDLATEIMAQLLQTSASSADAAAGAPQAEPLLKILKKTKYEPVQLTAATAPDQSVSFDNMPDQVKLFLYFNGKTLIADSFDLLNKYNPNTDGPCYVLLEARWDAANAWQTNQKGLYCFIINYDRPAQFELSGLEFDPGELLVIYAQYLTTSDKVSVQSDLPFSPNFVPYGSREMIALVPLSYDLRAGQYTAALSVGENTQTFDITLKDKEFPVQNLTISDKIAEATRNEESNKEFKEKIQPLLEARGTALLWSSAAEMPVPGAKRTTQFGTRRYINDDANSYRHTGIDLAIARGTEIKAINNGKVIFSEKLIQTGNTILIEHGLGLISWYYHLDELRVVVGDDVKKGDILGTVGSTGFSTGPHLHLNLSVNGTYIDPNTALAGPLFRDPLK